MDSLSDTANHLPHDPLGDVPNARFPRHIAVIMDGNGRWAVQRGLERVRGHQQGARTVRDVVTECARLRREHGGPDFLTLYSFSLENWKRPMDEVSFLMQMYVEYWIPAQVRHPYPVVLVHGGQGQGSDWISTPDGRRGWVSILLEPGYKVYVAGPPGQGRPAHFPWFTGDFGEQAPTDDGGSG